PGRDRPLGHGGRSGDYRSRVCGVSVGPARVVRRDDPRAWAGHCTRWPGRADFSAGLAEPLGRRGLNLHRRGDEEGEVVHPQRGDRFDQGGDRHAIEHGFHFVPGGRAVHVLLRAHRRIANRNAESTLWRREMSVATEKPPTTAAGDDELFRPGMKWYVLRVAS